jgi:hypothetical protein
MYPGWQIPQSGFAPRCGGIFWSEAERRLRSFARAGKMAEVRTVGEKMVEARMVGRLSQVLVKEKTAAAAMKARGAARSVQQRRS